MRCDENKTELFQMISSSSSKINYPTQTVTTKLSDAESNYNIDTTNHQPCNRKEADSHMVVHLIDASKRGVNRVLVATVDTDVVALLIYHFSFFKFKALWVEMGVG